MRLNRVLSILLSCVLILSCATVSSKAVEPYDGDVVPYAFGRLNHRIGPGSGIKIGSKFNLNVGDEVTFDCDYVPASASVDFGVIAPDRKFYSLNSTSGSIHQSIEVDQQGQYTIAIRNNSSEDVTVAGEINY